MPQMSTPSSQPSASTPTQVGPHKPSVVGVTVVSRTAACARYTRDADRVSRMTTRVSLLCMSAWEVASFGQVAELAATHDIDTLGAVKRFIDMLGDFDRRLWPLDWVERPPRTYITLRLLINLGMVPSESLEDPLRRGLVHEPSQDPISTHATAELEEAIATDPQLAAWLGLQGRHIIGEEIGTFQRLLGQFLELPGQMAQEQLYSVLTQGAISHMRGLGLRV